MSYIIDDEFRVLHHSIADFYLFNMTAKETEGKRCPEHWVLKDCINEVLNSDIFGTSVIYAVGDSYDINKCSVLYGIVIEDDTITVTDVYKMIERREAEEAAQEEAEEEFKAAVEDLQLMGLL